VARICLGPGATAGQRRAVARIVQSCPRRVRAEWGRVLAGLDLTARLPLLDLPAAVLYGTADRLTPPAHARRLAAALPRPAGVRELPGIGHMTPVEAPGEVAAAVRALVRAHGADRPAGALP
jgi:pimeloyl-ACP methyl ester carboxylesterase